MFTIGPTVLNIASNTNPGSTRIDDATPAITTTTRSAAIKRQTGRARMTSPMPGGVPPRMTAPTSSSSRPA